MLPGVEGGCSHVAMSSGEHEDEHEEALSGVAAMESWRHRAVVLEQQRRDGETSLWIGTQCIRPVSVYMR